MADQYAPGLIATSDNRDVTTITGSSTDGIMAIIATCGGAGSTTAGKTTDKEFTIVAIGATPSTTTLPNVKCPVIALDTTTGKLHCSLGAPGATPTSYTDQTA